MIGLVLFDERDSCSSTRSLWDTSGEGEGFEVDDRPLSSSKTAGTGLRLSGVTTTGSIEYSLDCERVAGRIPSACDRSGESAPATEL